MTSGFNTIWLEVCEAASPNLSYVTHENKENDKNSEEHWKCQPNQWLDQILVGIFINHKVGHSGLVQTYPGYGSCNWAQWETSCPYFLLQTQRSKVCTN